MRNAIGVAALVLAGCSWSDVLVTEIKSLPAESSFGYQEGYEAGCRTGIAQNGGLGFDKPKPTWDESRIGTEDDYRKGWDEGATSCADKYAGVRAPYYPPAK